MKEIKEKGTNRVEDTGEHDSKPSTDSLTLGLTPEEKTRFFGLAEEKSFEAGAILFHEHDDPDGLYVIQEGEAEVFRQVTNEFEERSHILAVLKPGDVIGDMALIENKPRSASLRAKTALKIFYFPLDEIRKDDQIRLILFTKLAKKLSERLRNTNQVTVENMEEKLNMALARNALGSFMIALFWLLSLYTLFLNNIVVFKNQSVSSTPVSVGIIFVITVGLVMAMRKTGLPLSRFGITWKDWHKKTLVAILYSLPLALLILLIKAYVVFIGDNPHHIRLFSGPDEYVVNGVFEWKIYLTMIFLYSIFSPLQELTTRSAMQSTFFLFLPGGETYRKWNAIVLSNLIFAAVHSHLSILFAGLAFAPGIFWGWLFHKQRSLVAVSVSHIFLGVWATCIIGVQGVA